MKEARCTTIVIVGAGSAGCVLAARLSEDPGGEVALLEAGGAGHSAGDPHAGGVPDALQVERRLGPAGEPEPGLGDRRLFLPRGKVLGGSSSINAMIYIRGNRADYDGWAAVGARAGATTTCCPTSSASEDNERGEDEFHGVGGPLTVSDSRSMSPLIDAMIEAAHQAGPRAEPRLQRRPPGGRRPLPAHAARWAALRAPRPLPASGDDAAEPRRPHRRVGAAHPVRRRARSGVEFARDGEPSEVRAEREVILSAGAYHSPQLLMLSGIGPADDLQLVRNRRARGSAGRPEPAGPLMAHSTTSRRAVAVRRVHAREPRAVREEGRGR